MKNTKNGKFYQSSDIKVCRVCHTELLDEVNFKSSLRKHKNWICNQCKNEYDLRLLKEKPFRNHASAIRRYKITQQDYEKMYKDQDGRCKICKLPAPMHSNDRTRLYVDHCHTTKKVRGLLCKNCNSGIGQFKESIESMLKAIEYLKTSLVGK